MALMYPKAFELLTQNLNCSEDCLKEAFREYLPPHFILDDNGIKPSDNFTFKELFDLAPFTCSLILSDEMTYLAWHPIEYNSSENRRYIAFPFPSESGAKILIFEDGSFKLKPPR